MSIVNKRLLDYSRHQSLLPKFKSSLYLYIIVCLVISVTLLLLTYFLYDVVVTFPIGLAIATTWLVFRNNDIRTDCRHVFHHGNLKNWLAFAICYRDVYSGSDYFIWVDYTISQGNQGVGTLLFTAFLIYDIFFVFITPLFILSFDFVKKIDHFLTYFFSRKKQFSGIFIQFLAFYDACWRAPYYRHFLGGILGWFLLLERDYFLKSIFMINLVFFMHKKYSRNEKL
ncbi:uncharacterized protein DC041_0011941 [Schistosoma bovis]|uniref:Uncharacterized protein n=1 Tax=Schistosoma bovis TaxID=6184 RepID=A0A430QFG0_SCHBO|nr:uncharacterized protein DC041_0011941 [Schistosoma bovis]